MNDEDLYQTASNELILREGFLNYGGLPGRDPEANAVGLREGLEESYLAHQLGQTRLPATRLEKAGIPTIQPAGGHAVDIDAGALLPHLPPHEFPGQALSLELYLAGGVRAVELGSVTFAHPDPDTGEMVHPRLELVRLALPRRVYTQTHYEYVARTLGEIGARTGQLRGYRMTYAPRLLRHFTARFEPLTPVPATQGPGD